MSIFDCTSLSQNNSHSSLYTELGKHGTLLLLAPKTTLWSKVTNKFCTLVTTNSKLGLVGWWPAGERISENDHRQTEKLHRNSENEPSGSENDLDHNTEAKTDTPPPCRGAARKRMNESSTGVVSFNSCLSMHMGCCKYCCCGESECSASVPPSSARF